MGPGLLTDKQGATGPLTGNQGLRANSPRAPDWRPRFPGQGSLNANFKQFICKTCEKSKSFYLKVATPGPRLTLLWTELFTSKALQEAMFVTSPCRPNHLQLKFYTIMQDSKSVLGFNCKKRIEQLNFFDWLWNVKNLVLWNGSELVRNVIQWDLNSFFFQKLTKIAQRLRALPPDPHSHRRLGALPPGPRLWYVWVH